MNIGNGYCCIVMRTTTTCQGIGSISRVIEEYNYRAAIISPAGIPTKVRMEEHERSSSKYTFQYFPNMAAVSSA